MSTSEDYKARLGEVFDHYRESLRDELSADDYRKLRNLFVFHMTDWLEDFDRLSRLRSEPGAVPTEEAQDSVFAWSIHVLPHLQAAARLLVGDTPDTFEDDPLYQLIEAAEKTA
jgi:hypothetical protein